MAGQTKAERIQEKRDEIDELQKKIDDLRDGGAEDDYDAALDEQGDLKIGSLSFSPSYVLKELDEIAYNLGYDEYIDESVSEYEEKISELEDEIKEIEAED